jgi:hypothetical protein
MEHSLTFEDPAIEMYLTAVERSMMHVPMDRRVMLLTELRSHIDRLVEDDEAAGTANAKAVAKALSMMGPPRSIGREYTRMWRRSTEGGNALAAFGIITLAGVIGSAVLTPYVTRIDTLVGDRWDWITTLQTLSMVAGPVAIGGLLAGWLTPRGAMKAAYVRAAITIAFTSVMLIMPPHETVSLVRLQLESAFAGGFLCVAAASIGRRLRLAA